MARSATCPSPGTPAPTRCNSASNASGKPAATPVIPADHELRLEAEDEGGLLPLTTPDAGTVGVIGIGRPMTFVPNHPAQILAGQQPRLPRNPPHLGYRPLDGYLELARHNDQVHTIAAGRTPQRYPGVHTLGRAATRISVGAMTQVTISSMTRSDP